MRNVVLLREATDGPMAFDREVSRVLNTTERIGEEAAKKAADAAEKAIDNVNRKIVENARDYPGELKYEAYMLPKTQAATREALKEFQDKYQGIMDESLEQARKSGMEGTASMLSKMDLGIGFDAVLDDIKLSVSVAQLEAAGGITAQFVTKMAQEQIDLIASTLRVGYLERLTIPEMSERLYSESVQGVTKARATAIARTETMRMESAAAHRSLVAESEVLPNIGKRWIAGFTNTREEHANAHNLYSENPIPVNEPFIVGGEEMMYPRDSGMGASAWNIVNCACITSPGKIEE